MQPIDKYIEHGFTIIPVPLKQKFPSIKWQQYQENKPTKAIIKEWFKEIENVAIITGKQSNICVVDLDSKDAINFAKKHNMFNTPTVKTSKGFHLYFKYEEGMRNFQKVEQLPGIDFRAEGGLVIAPPSVHPTGAVYKWITGLDDHEIQPLPNILRSFAFKKKSNISNKDEKINEIKDIPIMDIAVKLGIDTKKIDDKNQMKCFTGHDKDTKSLTFYPDTNSFHCFGCLIAGSNIDLVMEHKSCGFAEAIQWIKLTFGLVKNNQMKLEDITAEETEMLNGLEFYENIPLLFKTVLVEVKPINFKNKYLEIAGYMKEKPLTREESAIIVVTEILEILKKHKFKITNKNQQIYMYNGAYWFIIDKNACDVLLIDCANKMGTNPMISKSINFRETMYKQLEFESYNLDVQFKNRIAINLQNGTLLVKKGKPSLTIFTHTDFFTYILKFNYDVTQKCPMFIKYLDRVLPDRETQKALQEFFGYIFTKNTDLKLEKILILFGEGHNGKSVIFDIMNYLLGEKNITSFNSKDLDEEHYRAMIVDKLLNYSSEFGAGMNVETFKQLASGEPISARHKYGHPFIAANYCRFAFNANTLPKNIENNVAFFRRLLIIPFTETITEQEKDVNLANKIIETESSGVFNWVLEGLARILKNKHFTQADLVDKVLDQYKYDRDSVRRFLDDESLVNMLSQQASHEVPLKNLYEAYKDFCSDDGSKPLGKVNFSKRLDVLGYKRVITTHNVYCHMFEKVKQYREKKKEDPKF